MISKRLQTIAEFVTKDKVVFDVGTDHALLPCFLVESGICDKVYAADIAIGPLNHAKETIKSHRLEGKVVPVLSDGLEKAGEDVDIVTISGMGFHTIKEILDKKDLSGYERIILESNKDNNLLRQYLSDRNYTVIDETVVYDGFYYEIIVFNTDFHEKYSDLQIKYGPVNLAKREKEFIDYLKFRKSKLVSINEKACKMEYEKEINELSNLISRIII